MNTTALQKRFSDLESKKLSHRTLKRHVWDVFSFLGHIFFQKYPPDIRSSDGKRYLNLGAGDVIKDGFVNADFYRLHKIFTTPQSYWMVDITKPLKCHDDFWDGIHLEHVNEHLSYVDNLFLFSELFRTLKPGGIVRICMPDLDKYLDWENIRHQHPKMNRYSSLPEALSNLSQNHLHISIWNYQLLNDVLSNVGFSVKKMSFGRSEIDVFEDSPNHEWQSVYLEAKKPSTIS